MKNIQKNKAQESKWFSADAWNNADSWDNADAWNNADDWDNADAGTVHPAKGGTSKGNMKKSAPYILQIVNSCTCAISSVDIGDSYTNRAAVNFNQNSAITIQSTISGVLYIEFLAQSETQPSKIGMTMIISSTSGQLDQTVAITHRDSTGDRRDHIIVPTIDPYQQQTDRIIDEYEYLFNGYTRLRFNSILASATVTVRMYPAQKFSATHILSAGGKQAGAPALAKPSVVRSRLG
jgi:hypothetical protein